jgi:hypothetical protein
MAVVKLNYIRSRLQIKKHLRYIVHRRGEKEGTITRALFDNLGETDKQSIYAMIDSADRGTLFYKIMMNFHPVKEDTYKDLDLQHITRQTILALQNALGRNLQFVATIHPADHTPLRHVHGLFLVPGRLSKVEFRALRQTAYKEANRQARLQRRARDRVLVHPRYRTLSQYQELMQSARTQHRGGSAKPRPMQAACSHCGYGGMAGIPAYKIFCPSCNAILKGERMQVLRL